ncbi:MAG: response regulator [Myxococcales bacterium]|nr:response regulator [Myxococcales bacterium]
MAKHILCADDSATIQKMAAITFAGSEYVLHGVRSGDEALAVARRVRPMLVLADAVMPGQDGYELCRSVKADPALHGVPVFILCGNSSQYDEARGSSAGADGHVTKPWDTQALLDRVGDVLARAALAGASALATPTLVAAPAPIAMVAPVAPAAPAVLLPPPPGTARPSLVRAPLVGAGAASRPSMIGLRAVAVRPAAVASVASGQRVATVASVASGQRVATPALPPAAAPPPTPPPAPTVHTARTVIAPRPTQLADTTRIAPSQLAPAVAAAAAGAVASAAAPAIAAAASAAGLRHLELEAITRLSREVIEKIAWEVVPELAEQIIREQLDRLVAARR